MKTWTQWVIRIAGVALSLVPLTGRSAEAEVDSPARRTLLLAQPVYGSSSQLGASVEHALGSHVALAGAVQASLNLASSQYENVSPEFTTPGLSTRRWGVGVDPGVHVYLAGRAPEGFWLGAHLEASVLHHKTWNDVRSPEARGTLVTSWRTLEYGGSARAGYTAILSPGLTVQVGLGLAALASRNTSFTVEEDVTGVSGSVAAPFLSWQGLSFSPRMTLGVGWAL